MTDSLVPGFHVSGAVARIGNYEVNREVCLVPGFSQLQWYLARHAEISELYLLLMALLLGQRVNKLPNEMQVRVDFMSRMLLLKPIIIYMLTTIA